MKKAFDQTVRDLKREVNKKVLKVPGIEQKILDATNNEPWGPHGSYLAEIAQATQNYHEYQMIMSVIWKRINDTGKNWRHVYKGLTVLEYLVAHGSERVIDDIREHAYQISTLSDFQYIDSHGRDQGNNVRRKSQSLVALVNDKERIQEARQKALANKDKYRSTFSMGGMYKTGYGGGNGDRYDDDRYEGRYRDDDYNGYSRERDGSYRDDDRYGRNGDSYNHDVDRFGRDPDRFGSRNDDYQFGSRSRSADRARGRSFDDEDRYSSRSGGGRADESSHDERHVGHKSPEQTGGAPPGYEEATKAEQNQIPDERDGKPSAATADPTPKVVSAPPKASPHSETTNSGNAAVATSMAPSNTEAEVFDEFDPRGFTSVAVNSVEVDLFGSFSAEDSLNSLALVPVSAPTTSESDVPVESGCTHFSAMPSTSTVLDQSSTDPFGDSPFRATKDGFSAPVQNITPFGSSEPTFEAVNNSAVQPAAASKVEPSQGFDFGESFQVTNTPSSAANFQPPATQVLATPPSNDVLDTLFTPSNGVAPAFPSQVAAAMPPARSQTAPAEMFAQSVPPVASQAVYQNQFSHPGMPSQVAPPNPFAQSGASSQMVSQNHFDQPGLPSAASSPNLLGPSVLAPTTSAQPPNTAQSKNKFEMKSAVWADTLSRGLVDLNISGLKVTNSAVDIGVDFDSINRKEKMKEKKNTSATPMSTITMGKAMGSGSGIGRSGATGFPPPPNPMLSPRPGMGMGAVGMSSGFGGGMNMGGGDGGGMNQGMGMGMNMGMGQGAAVRPGYGIPPGAGMPGVGYNPMLGMGGYGSQQPYGGYR